MTIQIVLAGDPQGKGRPRFVRSTGHAFTPATTRSYESALRYAAQSIIGSAVPLAGPLSVTMTAIFPVPTSWSAKKRLAAIAGTWLPTVKPDADNLLKSLDACNGIVWVDDKQIVDARVVKLYGERPRLVIDVSEISDLGSFQRLGDVANRVLEKLRPRAKQDDADEPLVPGL